MAGEKTPEEKRAKRRELFGRVGRALAGIGLPILGGAVGGPMGAQIAGRVASALGLSEDAGPDEIEEAVVAADPALLVQLRQIELDMQNAQLAAIQTEEQEVSKRWQADMASDSVLSKNVRPAMLILVVVAFLVFVFLAGFGSVTPPAEITDAIRWLASAFVLSYVGGRTLEKGGKIMKGGGA